MATELNCSACEDLRQSAPNFAINGLGETECTSLANNTGLEPSAGHDDCTDLNNMNDCLIGTMEKEVSAYAICDWKSFMKAFIPNLWTTLKGIICSICGIWTKLTCIYNGLVNLTDYLASTTSGIAFVRYYRDQGADQDVPYWENIVDGWSSRNHGGDLEIFMDSGGASSGSIPADRDYVVLISNCTNMMGFYDLNGFVTYYSSGDNRPIATIREHLAQHPSITFYADGSHAFNNFSWTTSGAVLLKKGEHIKVNFYVSDVDKHDGASSAMPKVRLHQFILTWIPVNVSEALDPSKILDC